MLELTIYGLMGLAGTLVIAFYCAYADEFSAVREKSSLDPINNAHLNASQMIETRTGSPRFRETVAKRQETVPAPLLLAKSPAETDSGAIHNDTFQSDRGRGEAFHG